MSRNDKAEYLSSPSRYNEFAGIKKALMDRDGRGEEWRAEMEREREFERERGKAEGGIVRAGVANEKILRGLRECLHLLI